MAWRGVKVENTRRKLVFEANSVFLSSKIPHYKPSPLSPSPLTPLALTTHASRPHTSVCAFWAL